MIRDSHTHFFSRALFDALARLAPGDRPICELLEEVTERAGIELPSEDHSELLLRWLEQMDHAGVELMVTFASLPGEADVVADAVANSGGRLAGYVVVNPVADGAEKLIERVLGELGLKGLVLFPAMHHYDLSDDACRPALEMIRTYGAVAVVHCGILRIKLRDLLGLPRTYDARFASPLSLVRAASEFPEIPFVIPHFGAGMFQETLLAGSWCENVYVDTSSSNSWMSTQVSKPSLAEVFERALDVFGPTRILFGTDSSTFPRGYREDVLEQQTRVLETLDLSDEDRTAILSGNLARLLAL